MFSRRSARARRASRLGSVTEKARSFWSASNVDRLFGFRRDYARKLGIELLEDRRLLAYTASLNFGTSVVTFTGNAAVDTLVLSIDGAGNLQHNRFSSGDPGFASDIDLDSTVPGVQSLPAKLVTEVFVTDTGANDTLRVQLGSGAVNARLQPQNLVGASAADLLTSDNLPPIQFANLATFRLVAANDQTQATFVTKSLDGAATYQFESPADATAIFEGDDSRNDSFQLRRVTAGPQTYDVTDTFAGRTVSLFNFVSSFDRIQFNTLGGDDTLAINVDAGAGSNLIAAPVGFDGGDGTDTLQITGIPSTVVSTETYTPGLQVDEGRLEYLDNLATRLMVVDFDNLEPVIDESFGGTLQVQGNGADNTITYKVDPSNGSRGLVTVDGTESIAFKNKTTLRLVGGNGNDLFVFDNSLIPTGLTTIIADGDDFGTTIGGGNDTFRLLNANVPAAPITITINGESGDDLIDASLLVQARGLQLVGSDGNDTIIGGPGDDTITGGAGNDTIIVSAGIDSIDGGTGSDALLLQGTVASNVVSVTQTATANVLAFTNDAVAGTITGTSLENFRIELGDGNDQLAINLPNTQLIDALPIFYDGGTGFNTLTVQGIFGGAANSIDNVTYTPGLQADEGRLLYTDGAQVMDIKFDNLQPVIDTAAAAQLVVNGNGAANAITLAKDPATADAAARGLVSIDGFETISFSNKTDITLNAAAGDDIVNVNIGAAVVIAGLSTITVNANDGNDTVRFQNLPTAAAFTRATVNAGAGNDTIDASNIPATTLKPLTLNGEEGNDTITGGPNGDTISGGTGNDIIIASPGNDVIDGVSGDDQLNIIGRILPDIIAANQTAANTLVVTYNGNARTYTVSNLDLVFIDGGLGDDVIAINVVDTVAPASSLPFNVIGNSPNASDRLIVNDDGPGDLVIQRQAPDGRSGSIVIGSTTQVAGVNSIIEPPKVRVTYESIERVDITPIDPQGRTGTDAGGQLIVFHYDNFESNDALTTATLIGGTPIGTAQLFVGQRNIDPGPLAPLPAPFPSVPGDSDWYEFRPDRIGTFRFQALFEQIDTTPNGRPGLPDDGDLKIEVYRADGTLIGASDTSANTPFNIKTSESFDISAAANTSYYVRVFASNLAALARVGAAINNYELNVTQVDQGGPQVFTPGGGVNAIFPNNVTGFDLFHPKSNLAAGATPLIFSLTINIQDLPNRAPGDPYPALDVLLANSAAPGLYSVVGDHVGIVDISSVVVTNNPVIVGQPATATITLTFSKPLPDDRFTLTLLDAIQDPAGNKLDGESDASEPGVPTFPSGNGIPGGNFVARFTVDSRPEVGTYVSQDIDIDINGNYYWDPANSQIGNDATNVDLSFTLGVQNTNPAGSNNHFITTGGFGVNDMLIEGKFTNGVLPPVPPGTVLPQRLYEQLAAYGTAADLGGIQRWLVDINGDGVITLPGPSYTNAAPVSDGADIMRTQGPLSFPIAGAIPIAGNFDGNLANGDEVGLYYAGNWGLDSRNGGPRDFTITQNEVINDGLNGSPIVGDFDGDGLDDLAVFNSNIFYIDFANNGFTGTDRQIIWGFPGTLDKPVAADMDQDGIDDLGIWEPRNSGSLPRDVAEWYFLLSGAPTAPVTGGTRIAAPSTTQFFATTLIGNTTIPASGVEVRFLSTGPGTTANFGLVRTGSFNSVTGLITLNSPLPVAPAAGDIISIGGIAGVTLSDHAFRPTPFGNDISAEFGDEAAVPLLGNLDPPVSPAIAALATTNVAGDYDNSGRATSADYTVWRGTFGSTTNMLADGNHNTQVDAGDFVLWRKSAGASGAGSSLVSGEMGSGLAVVSPSMISSALPAGGALEVEIASAASSVQEGNGTATVASISVAAPKPEAPAANLAVLDSAFGDLSTETPTRAAGTLTSSDLSIFEENLLLLDAAQYSPRAVTLASSASSEDSAASDNYAIDSALNDFEANAVLEPV